MEHKVNTAMYLYSTWQKSNLLYCSLNFTVYFEFWLEIKGVLSTQLLKNQ